MSSGLIIVLLSQSVKCPLEFGLDYGLLKQKYILVDILEYIVVFATFVDFLINRWGMLEIWACMLELCAVY